MNTLLNTILMTLGIVVIILGLIFIIHYTDRPEVIKSWSTKECIKVINTDGTKGDCNNIPERYDLIWGE